MSRMSADGGVGTVDVTRTRLTLDVSRLPPDTMDHRSPIWWGNLLMMIIETTMFGILVAAYFYLRANYDRWPPVRPDGPVGLYYTDPLWSIATINLIVILLSVVPMAVADMACLKHSRKWVIIGIALCMVLQGVSIWLRFKEFGGLLFRWDENAYASTVWTILGLHLLHLITGTCENSVMLAWVVFKNLDQKHARDVRVGCVYWYWVAGIWVILFGVVYVAPRLL